MTQKHKFTLKHKKCILYITTSYTDSVIEGMTDEEDKFPGVCNFEIPLKFFKPLLEFYGRDNYKLDWSSMEDCIKEGSETYNCTNPDEYIYFLHYLINNYVGIYELAIATDTPLWPIHDFFHAINDFNESKTFNCTAEEEVIRIRQAVSYMKRNGMTLDRNYLRDWTDTFNARKWGCDYEYSRKRISLSTVTSYKRINEVNL